MAATVCKLCDWRTAKGLAFKAGRERGERAAVILRAADKFRGKVEVQDTGRAADQGEARPARTGLSAHGV